MRNKLTYLVVFSLLTFVPAHASLIYSLTADNCTGTCGTNPFGTVTLTQNGSNVDVSVALIPGDNFVSTGAGPTFAFDISGNPSITITGLDTTHFTALITGSGHSISSAFGTFEYQIESNFPGNSGNVTGPLNFTVSDGGTLLVTDFIANASGHFFAADIFGSNGNTGEVADGGCTSGCDGGGGGGQLVPEPVTFLLTGTGLVGAFFLRRRRTQ